MADSTALIGRREEQERLAQALQRADAGNGALILIAGEAGVGKTRLADTLASAPGVLVLRGRATSGAASPYGLIGAALRSQLRSDPKLLDSLGPLKPHLAGILPELGAAAEETNRATLFEAVCAAVTHLGSDRRLVLLLDDLHWSDAATLELLSALAEPLCGTAVVIVGTYRSDGLPRDHTLRRLRNELRRAGRLDEIVLDPLSATETEQMLAQILGDAPSESLTRAVHDRTLGVPFFVEEFARALTSTGVLQPGEHGLELASSDEVPLPDSVRDAVLLGLADLSEEARAAADAAAVAGDGFDLDVVADIAGSAALAELLEHGIANEAGNGLATFRHALSRESIYADIPWLRRRALHRQVAAALETNGAPSAAVATHWVGARDTARARDALVRAVTESEALHAYRDAADAGRQALDLWSDQPGDGHDPRRLEALEHYAANSELAGDLTEAIRAQRELSDLRGSHGDALALAKAQRRLAALYDMRGERESAFAARRVAAQVCAENGHPDAAALDHLAMANHLRLSSRHSEAVELARTAVREAELAGRADIRARARGLEGLAQAKAGDYDAGLATVRESLAQALDAGLTGVVAELYQRLSIVLYEAADYRSAAEALDTALDLCRTDGSPNTQEACVSCLAYVLRDLGEWTEASRLCRELVDQGRSVFVAEGLLGSIQAYQGRTGSGRRLLTSCLNQASRIDHYNMTVDSTAGFAFVAAAEGAHDEAAQHCRSILNRWRESQDHHYALSGLRWSAVYLARQGDRAAAHEFTDALSTVASTSGQPEALAAVGHAIAELALLDGDAQTAAEQLTNALELHRTIDMPFVRAQIELRAGVALGAAGETEAGLERLADAYRAAKKIGARPLAAEAARETAALDASVVERLGRRAQGDADGTGLSRRERDVVRLVAVGRTNREIAQELFLSTRTVDMHVRNILRKLDCRSRVEAAHRAGELGLVG
jgi:DNA-binding NarL/FixJ family response regulator